jgi:foldase protein PrsA
VLYSCKSENKVVAKVEDQVITQDELNQELNRQYGLQTLQSLITQKLIVLEAKKKNINVSDDEIKKELEKISLEMGGLDKLQEQLKSKGITLEEYKDKLKIDLLLKKLVILQISEDEIKVFYENNKDNFPLVEVSFIMVPDKNMANSIIKSLNNGADFSKLAETYSQDPLSKDTKGYVGFLSRRDISRYSPSFKKLEDEIFKNPQKGKFIGPIEIDYSKAKLYYIVKYNNVLSTYEEVKPKIQEILAQQKVEDYVQNLRKNANIQILYGNQESKNKSK